ncbi:MAG: haloacid dehalogenase-like hydrolase [Gammaproteobacteria bacterium]|nr:haloacid dehalogenase-like hydrolase [Gammaproteobacteria bacterium]
MTSPSEGVAANPEDVPLVVDVDGTLVATDVLAEVSLRLLALSPWRLLTSAVRGLRGRAAFKRAATKALREPTALSLVLNPAVVEEIDAARRSGRPVWLASGADALVVEPLAKQIDADGFLASDGERNLVGNAKAEALVERFGEGRFDYVGNDRKDLPVWRRARQAMAVGASARLARRVLSLHPNAKLIEGLRTPVDYIKALRPHQCAKNALVFVAPVAAHAVDIGT